MIAQTTNIDDLMRQHLELAIRLYDTGCAALAVDVALAALRHEPPALDSPLLQFLIRTVVTLAMNENKPEQEQLRSRLESNRQTRESVAWWLRFWSEGSPGESPDAVGDCPNAEQASAMLARMDREQEDRPAVPPRLCLPFGCTQGVIVESSGQAHVTRVYVRFIRQTGFNKEQNGEHTIPGRKAAVEAAKHYLAKAGCRPIDDYQAEVLVEGLFRPVQGESLALAVFVAAVSASLQMPISSEWAFTGAVGSASADSAGGTVMPVNELRAKLAACTVEGCAHLIVPAHLVSDDAAQLGHGARALVPVDSTTQAIETVLPQHRLAESPRIVGWREALGAFVGGMMPHGHRPLLAQSEPRHRLFRMVVPLFFALMVTQRWLIGDYLIPEYYWGIYRPPVWLAALLGCLAALILAGVVLASLRVVDRLMDHEAIASWWVIAAFLLAGHVLAWLLLQVLIRDPFAQPPRGLYLEHRTLHWWKDTLALFFYALLFFVSPYSRVRLAERAAMAGRLRWANEILQGRRWAAATLPITTMPLLVVIASIGFMGLAHLDYQGLVDSTRAGADSAVNGPWRTILIVSRAYLYLSSCVLGLWWLARATSRVNKTTDAGPARDRK